MDNALSASEASRVSVTRILSQLLAIYSTALSYLLLPAPYR